LFTKEKRASNRAICAPVAFIFFLTSGAAVADPLPPKPTSVSAAPIPQECDAKKYLESLGEFREKKGDRECKLNARATCNFIAGDRVRVEEAKSVCVSIYKKIVHTVDHYEKEISKRCDLSNQQLKLCKNIVEEGSKKFDCLQRLSQMVKQDQARFAGIMAEAASRLKQLESQAKSVRDFYDREKEGLIKARNLAQSGTLEPISDELKECLGAVESTNIGEVFKLNSGRASKGKLIDEQDDALALSEEFRKLAQKAQKEHDANVAAFGKQANAFGNLKERTNSIQPDMFPKNSVAANSKSDITGPIEQSQPAPAQQQQAGAQEQEGKGSGSQGGGGASNQGGAGATAGTPASFNSGSSSVAGASSLKNNVSQDGRSSSDAGSPRNGVTVADSSVPLPQADSSFGGSGLSSNFSSSPVSSRKTRSANRKPASSGAPSGSGLGDSFSSKSCLGEDCQQALGDMKSTQFAKTGSLGSGGGLGSNGDFSTDALDSLFGSGDSSKSVDVLPGSFEVLNGAGEELEGGLVTEINEGIGSDGQSAGGGIGKEEMPLFQRVNLSLVRAQKRGNVAGIPKKL